MIRSASGQAPGPQPRLPSIAYGKPRIQGKRTGWCRAPGTGPQGFQSIATEIRVLYRVGLTDSAALQSVYSVADPQSLIRDDAGRLVLRFFNSADTRRGDRARRENIEAVLRDQLAADVDAQHAGVEILSVLIEEIHPPVGAAAAYHAVQAATINSTASIFEEQARAELTAGTSQQQAYQTTTAADAQAAETTHAADAQPIASTPIAARMRPAAKAFLTERYYASLQAALSKVPVTILDHHLNPAEGPFSISVPDSAIILAGLLYHRRNQRVMLLLQRLF